MSKIILHKAETRGDADHGWLHSRHTFSFAEYHDPQRMRFGALRVLNDDYVAEGMGFGTHPHSNMEIVSIPLEGDLEHKDSMGNVSVIKKGDIQVMSAGSGITHSEYNKNKDKPVRFLQIWVYPKVKNVEPRYDQITLDATMHRNNFQQIVSPNEDDQGVRVNQDAWFYLGTFDKDVATDYSLKKPGNGVYVFIIKGDATVDENLLNERDGLGIWETDTFTVKSNSSNTNILLIEIPMII
jgi:quercetin 2,3-dioxygenase